MRGCAPSARPVVEPDLASPAVVQVGGVRRSAVAAGARAVFGFPVAVGEVRFGALNLYRDRPGPLTADQHADALVVAEVAARSIISMQADAVPGKLGAGPRGRRQLPLRRSPGRRHGRRATRRPGRRGVGAAAGARLQQRRDRRRRRQKRSSTGGFASTRRRRPSSRVTARSLAPSQARSTIGGRDRETSLPRARRSWRSL